MSRRRGGAVGRWVGLGLVLLLASCTMSARPGTPRGTASDAIRVASFDFAESALLAQIYGQALRAEGFPVHVLTDAGSRELVEPALAQGLIDLVPEYLGSALSFVTLGATRPGPNAGVAHQELARALAPLGAVPLAPAAARNANAIVVTRVMAGRLDLHSVSDLAPVASRLRFGGPPECPKRPFCLVGLQAEYGLSFESFVPLDAGGPLTLQALRAGAIDVALLFTTDPALASSDLVELIDDRYLQPAENITPVVRDAILQRYGPDLATTVDAVSARLTTEGLRALVAGLSEPGRTPRGVAEDWLRAQDLLGAG